MGLPLLEGNYAKFMPQQAIVTDTVLRIQGFPVRGTGYPYYAWLPPQGNVLFTISPRRPPGAPATEGMVADVFYRSNPAHDRRYV